MSKDIRAGSEVSTGHTAPDQPKKAQARAVQGKSNARRMLARFALVGILLALWLAFSIVMPDKFFSFGNLRVILTTNSVMAILAIAALIPLVVGEFDLSGGAVVGLSGVLVAALTAKMGLGVPESVLLALCASTFIGAVNGVIVVRGGVNALITTLGMATVLQGVVFRITDGKVIVKGIPDAVVAITRPTVFGLPVNVFYMIIIAVVVWYVLDHTPAGRYMYAIGGGKEPARLAGINVQSLTIIAFVAAGLLAGIAGVILTSMMGTGNPTLGPNYMLPAFASAFLGAAAIKPGVFNVWGTVIAIFTVATGVAGLQLMGAEYWVDPVFNGVALIAAVMLTRILRRQAL